MTVGERHESVELALDVCAVRSWRHHDAASLARHASNRRIWLNLRDAFPHPYTEEDARRFIRLAMARDPETYFAIAVDGAAVGGIGYRLQEDVERCAAEIGYWVGEGFWGRGIATAAVRAVTALAFERHALTRIFAVPFASNLASARVLEKAGYVCEGKMRQSAIKDGQVTDQLLYAITRDGR